MKLFIANVLLSTIGWVLVGVGILLAIILIICLISWNIRTYNKLVKARNRVQNSLSQIDVQLKRRFDLIPNLVECVKGYAQHESEIYTKFAEARKLYSAASNAQDVEGMASANNQLTKLVSLCVEKYPELKADASFSKLSQTLSDTEDKIALTRQFYNDVVLTYNNLVEMFPGVIVARTFKFEKAKFFEIDVDEKDAPKISFSK